MTGWRLIGLGVALVLSACGRTPAPPAAAAPDAAAMAAVGDDAAGTLRPAVEMWNGGIYLAGIKPFLLLAAWDDGTVLVRGEPATARGATPQTALRVGQAPPEEIARLVKACAGAGFFRPPIDGPVAYPDGPMYYIILRDQGRTGELAYHGGDPGLDRIGPQALPSRAQMEAFHRLWRGAEAGIGRIGVSGLTPYRGPEPVRKR